MRLLATLLLLGLLLDASAQTDSPMEEHERLRSELARLGAAQQQLEQDYQRLQADNRRLNEDLAQLRRTAANAIAIDQRNERLEHDMIELERSLQLLQQENDALSDQTSQQWFIRGAGVLLTGLLIGVFLPRLRPRRGNRWGDL